MRAAPASARRSASCGESSPGCHLRVISTRVDRQMFVARDETRVGARDRGGRGGWRVGCRLWLAVGGDELARRRRVESLVRLRQRALQLDQRLRPAYDGAFVRSLASQFQFGRRRAFSMENATRVRIVLELSIVSLNLIQSPSHSPTPTPNSKKGLDADECRVVESSRRARETRARLDCCGHVRRDQLTVRARGRALPHVAQHQVRVACVTPVICPFFNRDARVATREFRNRTVS